MVYRIVRYDYRRKGWNIKAIKKYHAFLRIMSVGILIALSLYFYIVFFLAYIDGGSIIFSINDYGEGDYEMIMLTTLIPFILLDLAMLLKDRISEFFNKL